MESKQKIRFTFCRG